MIVRGRCAGIFKRWMKFNTVGALGICIQLISVFLFGSVAHINPLAATALAVEAAVLHNFIWHEHFTWADRIGSGHAAFWWRLAAFNGTTGILSIGGNVIIVSLLATHARAPLLLADGIAIAACSLVNFIVNDRLVFRTSNTGRTRESSASPLPAASQPRIFRICLQGRIPQHEPD